MAAAAPPLIGIVGPTAAGKSALALRLAALFPAEIVSCDSLQVYRGFDIGSSKATPEERALVPHHLLDVAEPDAGFSAADYRRQARAALAEVASRGKLPLVVGGSGLYFRALLRGIFEGPGRDGELRGRLERLADRFGDRQLHRLLRRVDPQAAARIAPRDRVRVVRAIEVLRATGRPIGAHHAEAHEPLRGYEVLLLGLNPGRERLRTAVETRVREMLAKGLRHETASLLAQHGPAARPLGGIGYRQAVAALEGRMSPLEIEPAMVRDSMRYAKRQMTWFRREPGIEWHAGSEEALDSARRWLGSTAPSL